MDQPATSSDKHPDDMEVESESESSTSGATDRTDSSQDHSSGGDDSDQESDEDPDDTDGLGDLEAIERELDREDSASDEEKDEEAEETENGDSGEEDDDAFEEAEGQESETEDVERNGSQGRAATASMKNTKQPGKLQSIPSSSVTSIQRHSYLPIPPFPPGFDASRLPKQKAVPRSMTGPKAGWDNIEHFKHMSVQEILGGFVHPDDICGALYLERLVPFYTRSELSYRIRQLYNVFGLKRQSSSFVTKRFSIALAAKVKKEGLHADNKKLFRELVKAVAPKQPRGQRPCAPEPPTAAIAGPGTIDQAHRSQDATPDPGPPTHDFVTQLIRREASRLNLSRVGSASPAAGSTPQLSTSASILSESISGPSAPRSSGRQSQQRPPSALSRNLVKSGRTSSAQPPAVNTATVPGAVKGALAGGGNPNQFTYAPSANSAPNIGFASLRAPQTVEVSQLPAIPATNQVHLVNQGGVARSILNGQVIDNDFALTLLYAEASNLRDRSQRFRKQSEDIQQREENMSRELNAQNAKMAMKDQMIRDLRQRQQAASEEMAELAKRLEAKEQELRDLKGRASNERDDEGV